MADGLTLERLAAAAGLPRARVEELCQRFVDCLPATGPRHDRRWTPEQVAILRNVHALDSAGYSVEAIRRQLAPSVAASPVASRAAGRSPVATPPPAAVEPAPPLSLEEALRTLGVSLDRYEVVRRAQFTINTRGILVDTTTPHIHMLHTWNALLVESASQRQARQAAPQPAPDADLLALSRWSVLLRLVGVLLDADRVRQCTLQIQLARPETPTTYEVQLQTGEQVRELNEDIQQLLLRRRAQYARRSRADERGVSAPRRRWWSRA
jgi:DNA-binding transcriptional MerR regulator